MQKEQIAAAIGAGDTFLGIEFGSTRIKAVLTDLAHQPIASRSMRFTRDYSSALPI